MGARAFFSHFASRFSGQGFDHVCIEIQTTPFFDDNARAEVLRWQPWVTRCQLGWKRGQRPTSLSSSWIDCASTVCCPSIVIDSTEKKTIDDDESLWQVLIFMTNTMPVTNQPTFFDCSDRTRFDRRGWENKLEQFVDEMVHPLGRRLDLMGARSQPYWERNWSLTTFMPTTLSL